MREGSNTGRPRATPASPLRERPGQVDISSPEPDKSAVLRPACAPAAAADAAAAAEGVEGVDGAPAPAPAPAPAAARKEALIVDDSLINLKVVPHFTCPRADRPDHHHVFRAPFCRPHTRHLTAIPPCCAGHDEDAVAGRVCLRDRAQRQRGRGQGAREAREPGGLRRHFDGLLHARDERPRRRQGDPRAGLPRHRARYGHCHCLPRSIVRRFSRPLSSHSSLPSISAPPAPFSRARVGLTGNALQADKDTFMHAGANAVLIKPTELRDILGAMKETAE